MNKFSFILVLLSFSLTSFALDLNCQNSDGRVNLTTDWIRNDGELILKLSRPEGITRYFSAHPLTLKNKLVFIPKIGDGIGTDFKLSLGEINVQNVYPASLLEVVIEPHLGRDDRMTKREVISVGLACVIVGDINVINICSEVQEGTLEKKLLNAAAAGKFDETQQYMACGVNVDSVNGHGCSALMLSTTVDGGDCGIPVPGVTRRDSYRYHRSQAIFKYLIDEGWADTDLQDINGESIAHKVARSFPQRIDILKDAGANLNLQDKKGMTPVMNVALSGYEKSVMMLVNAGVDLKKKNVLGQTAYDLGERLKPSVRKMLNPNEHSGIIVQGTSTGCSPSVIKVPMSKPTKITLKSTASDMYLLTAPGLGLRLMAAPNASASYVLNTTKMGTFMFNCGVHGGKQMTGKIIITM